MSSIKRLLVFKKPKHQSVLILTLNLAPVTPTFTYLMIWFNFLSSWPAAVKTKMAAHLWHDWEKVRQTLQWARCDEVKSIRLFKGSSTKQNWTAAWVAQKASRPSLCCDSVQVLQIQMFLEVIDHHLRVTTRSVKASFGHNECRK